MKEWLRGYFQSKSKGQWIAVGALGLMGVVGCFVDLSIGLSMIAPAIMLMLLAALDYHYVR